MEKIKGKTFIVLVLVTSMWLGLIMIGRVGAQATTIGVEPDKKIDPALVAGSTFTVEIWIRKVVDLCGVEFRLGYNTTVLTATLVEYGGIFGASYLEWTNKINETEGWLHYSISRMYGEPSFNGNGTSAIITFQVDSYGNSELNLYDTKLIDSDLPPEDLITHTDMDGYFSNKILGDVNGDKKVGSSDLFDLSKAYGSHGPNYNYPGEPPSPNWDPRCDFNWDGKVDASDLFDLSKNYGKTI